jgi:hypothetical protein
MKTVRRITAFSLIRLRAGCRDEQAVLTLTEALTGIHIEPLLTDFRGEAKLSGVGDVKARLNATGADMEAFKRTLYENVHFFSPNRLTIALWSSHLGLIHSLFVRLISHNQQF